MAKPTDLVQGTLDLLILRTLALQPMHGWGIAQRIRQVSKEVLQVNQGALYPALHRLEQQGWIRAKWGESENNRRAKYYSLTPGGAKYLRQEQAQWKCWSWRCLKELEHALALQNASPLSLAFPQS